MGRMLASLLNLSSLPTPLIALLLISLLPPAAATSNQAVGRLDTAGFWISFTLLVIVSGVECACSFFWTRYSITIDGVHPSELSARVCGRQITLAPISAADAEEIAAHGLPVGCHASSGGSASYSVNGVVMSSSSHSTGCSSCGGFETMRTNGYSGTKEVVIDKFGAVTLMPSLLIRRFNPAVSLEGPAGLVRNLKDIISPDETMHFGRVLERVVHLIVGLADFSLGAAGLALNTRSPHHLYDTLKSPTKAMSFANYSTLFLLYWLLGVVTLIMMIPLRMKRRSIQLFGIPGAVAQGIAALASLVLFGLGCWKIDYARRHGLPWTPMLSYWIGGASAISFPLFGIEVFHTFGVVGLVFMLRHMF